VIDSLCGGRRASSSARRTPSRPRPSCRRCKASPGSLAALVDGYRSRLKGFRHARGASEVAELAEAIIERWGQASFERAAAHVALSDLSGFMKLFLKVPSSSVGCPACSVQAELGEGIGTYDVRWS
jgi:hypothetical protein